MSTKNIVRNGSTVSVLITFNHKDDVSKLTEQLQQSLNNFNNNYTRCPNCQLFDTIEEHFGWRTINNKRIPQSWCKQCRKG